MRNTKRKLLTSSIALALLSTIGFGFSAIAADAKAPVKIGSTLALTGPLAATGIVHKIVGEIAIEDINSRGGLLLSLIHI